MARVLHSCMDEREPARVPGAGCASLCRPGAAYPLESRAGGDFAEWIRGVYEVAGDPLSEAGEPMRWLHGICRKEGRTDRLVNCLLRAEKAAQAQLEGERAACARERAAAVALEREVQFVRRMLESRDQQFAALQAEFVAMRRSWVWRLARRARCAAGRARRLLAPRGAPGWGRA
jgi:hypothetical protein